MHGNVHVRFLGGLGAAMRPGYPARQRELETSLRPLPSLTGDRLLEQGAAE